MYDMWCFAKTAGVTGAYLEHFREGNRSEGRHGRLRVPPSMLSRILRRPRTPQIAHARESEFTCPNFCDQRIELPSPEEIENADMRQFVYDPQLSEEGNRLHATAVVQVEQEGHRSAEHMATP